MKIPDKNLSRESWLDIVKPVELAGRLDHIPARAPITAKDRDIAAKQAYWLSKRYCDMPSGYSRIDWSKK